MRQRTLSYLYACYPLPSMIYQVSIKTSIYCLKCCISSKFKKHRRLVTATEVVVPSKDTEMIVPSKVTETIVPSKTTKTIILSKATETINQITRTCLVTGIASKIGPWIIKMLFTFLLHQQKFKEMLFTFLLHAQKCESSTKLSVIPIVLDYILHLKSDIVLPKADIDLLMMSLNPMVEEVISVIACPNLKKLDLCQGTQSDEGEGCCGGARLILV